MFLHQINLSQEGSSFLQQSDSTTFIFIVALIHSLLFCLCFCCISKSKLMLCILNGNLPSHLHLITFFSDV
jgi:hypothetical protein